MQEVETRVKKSIRNGKEKKKRKEEEKEEGLRESEMVLGMNEQERPH